MHTFDAEKLIVGLMEIPTDQRSYAIDFLK